MKHKKWIIFLTAVAITVLPFTAFATDIVTNADTADTAGKALVLLFKYLIIAAIFESVFACIFQWTWFVKKAHSIGAKTIIKIAISWIAVSQYKVLDIMNNISVELFNAAPQTTLIGPIITALVIAGGSSGIYGMLGKIGFRDLIQQKEKEERLAPSPASSLENAS